MFSGQWMVALTICLAWISESWAAASDAKQPNIILVMTDAQGYGPVGAHGHSWIKTPNLEALHGQRPRFFPILLIGLKHAFCDIWVFIDHGLNAKQLEESGIPEWKNPEI